MNSKIFAAALLLGASSTAVMAADLPSRRVAPAPVYAAPIFTWTGFYAGVQAGYAWDKVSVDSPFLGALSVNKNGFVGGGHVGYLYQSGPAVFGVEGDVEGTSLYNSALRASLRGRLGLGFDRTLLYVTGGLAVAGGGNGGNYLYNNSDTTRLGWTVGGGAEYAFAPNWSARLEYRYSDFGNHMVGYSTAHRTENAVRLGVSYHFSSPMAPVVAKY